MVLLDVWEFPDITFDSDMVEWWCVKLIETHCFVPGVKSERIEIKIKESAMSYKLKSELIKCFDDAPKTKSHYVLNYVSTNH